MLAAVVPGPTRAEREGAFRSETTSRICGSSLDFWPPGSGSKVLLSPQRFRCALNLLAFIRFPHSFISHHRRVWFLLVSRNSQRHSALSQARTRSTASDVIRSAVLMASVHSGSSGSCWAAQAHSRRGACFQLISWLRRASLKYRSSV